MKKKRNYREEFRVLMILIVIAFTVKTSIAEIYVVPTGSMEDTILVGDVLFGNKFIYGMKTPTWLGVPYTRMGFDVPWYRLPKFKEVENGDVVIFEYPRDPFQKYVKRCIGIPGDTIEIDSARVYVNGALMAFPEEGKLAKGHVKPESDINHGLYSEFDKQNEDNIDAFTVPYKGMEINFSQVFDWQSVVSLLVLDQANLTADIPLSTATGVVNEKQFSFVYLDPYEIAKTRGFIKYRVMGMFQSRETVIQKQTAGMREYIFDKYTEYANSQTLNPWRGPLQVFNDVLNVLYAMDKDQIMQRIKIDGVPLAELGSYSLEHDYFFLVGDNRDNSFDSRFWGFVPDYHVLGTPVFSVLNLYNLFSLNLTEAIKIGMVN